MVEGFVEGLLQVSGLEGLLLDRFVLVDKCLECGGFDLLFRVFEDWWRVYDLLSVSVERVDLVAFHYANLYAWERLDFYRRGGGVAGFR